MRPVTPTVDLPDNVKAVKFSAPEGQTDIGDIVGLVHQDQEGKNVALEFMFELTKDEIKVLRHEPYLTMTVMSDHLHPFALQTTFPFEQKYETLNEHSHICTDNITHESHQFWRCDNPSHTGDNKHRMCQACWEAKTSQEQPAGNPESDEVDSA